MTDAALQRTARAIARFRREGVKQEQAVAKARAMEQRGRLDRDGNYVHVPEVTEP